MTEISAALVKELRDQTGAGMMDCKRALQDTNGDLEAAKILLRERGLASAAKRAGRETTEGKVGYRVAGDAKRGVIVALGCETEPVSNNEEFLAFAAKVLEAVEREVPDAAEQLDEERQELAGKLGENIVFAGAARFEAVDGAVIDGYAHPPANKLGVLIQVRGGSDEIARKLAMHIAASPATRWIGREDVPDEIVTAEREIYANSDEVQSKPEQAREKIVEGMLNKRSSEEVAQPARAVFSRVLLKLSGEALMGEKEYGLDRERIDTLAGEIVEVQQQGVELAIVVGAGNIYRGMAAAAEGMDRATADYAGMLATLLNALALQDALERRGAHTRVLSAIEVSEVAEPYIRRRAIRHLEKQRIVIFAAGTGNPFFTTDTAAALRALEINAEAILMGKHGVEGVYGGDPRVDPNAAFLPELTHLQAIERGLKVMDTTALSLCMDNYLPIYVFALADGNIRRVVDGERVGTIVSTPNPGAR